VVPREAVTTGPDGQYVYAVRDGVAQQVPVRVLFDDSVNDAVQGNLKAGDQVIVDGQIRVIPGAKVNVTGVERGKGAEGSQTETRTSGRRRISSAQDKEG
jgi:multidrug efflux pump subunit AcrA (membrane-fusion protein)